MKKIRDQLTKSSLIWLGIFGLMSLSVLAGFWQEIDMVLMRYLQGFARPGLDCAVIIFGWFGSPEITGMAALVLAAFLARQRGAKFAFFFLVVMITATIIEVAAKLWLSQMPIPEEFHRRYSFLPSSFLGMTTLNSYPSGHIFRIGFLFFVIAKFWLRPLGLGAIFLGGLIVLLAVSRVYIGDHWPSDIVGGILLAWAASLWISPEKPVHFPTSPSLPRA